ncbi:MAG TPA: DNA-directed RNA polymerase subunit omega [Pyrinomonadaceae bacterium]|nr:DNA-directed RNA polymerase subunit omega [Pyrinomonadaceae bacterium]
MATKEELEAVSEETEAGAIDSKYRLIILAAKRSKQLQRGAHPRIDIDALKHKNTRVALEEVMRGRVKFTVNKPDGDGDSNGTE